MAGMDSGALERLRRLQMEDLGTARREYISTHERRRVADVGLDELDATRVANQAGSEAHRAAELNKARLASWANVHKDLSDTQDLENLDNLLDGQSHRAQLTALIRESGGQSYTKVLNKKDNFLKVAESDRGGPPNGRHSSGGRGGGVIGMRGRKITSSSPESGSSRTSHQGVIKKLGRHTVEAPLGRTRLDPALDVNDSSKNRLEKPKYQGNDSYGQLLRTNIRTRRPITDDYTRILSPPESFLAIARSVVQDNPSNDASAATPQSPKFPPNHNLRAEQPGDKPKNPAKGSPVSYQEYAQKRESVASPQLENASKPIPTLETSLYGMRAPNPAVAARSPAQNDKLKDSEYTSLQSPKLHAAAGRKNISTSPPAKGGASSERQPVPSFKEPSTPQAQIKSASVEPKEELLLDFGTTPPDLSPLHEKGLKSPAFEDLKGIDFEHFTNVNSSAISLHGRSNFDQQTESKKAGSKKETIVSSKGTSRSHYEREIFLLGVFLESTTLGEEYCDKFKKIKAELEEHLRNDHSQETTTEAVQKSFAYDKTSATNTESNTPADKSNMTPGVLLTAENTPTKHVEKPSTSTVEDNTGSQRLRQAINAPPFYPRSSSFSGYRSPINSTSSDSTPPPTPGPPQSKAIPINRPPQVPAKSEPPTEHIFGDHLLPGRRSRVASLRSTDEPNSRGVSALSHCSSLKPANILVPRSLHNASPTDEAASKDTTMSIKIPQQGSHTASNTEKLHAGTLFVQAKTLDATPLAQNVEPVSRESHAPCPGANPVSLKSPSIMASKETQGRGSKFTSTQQSINAMSPSPKTCASGNTPIPRTVESTTHANPTTTTKTSEPTKSPSIGMVKELPGPKPKLASIEQSIHAVSGWTSSKNQPSMSMPKFSQRPGPNGNPSERSSIYSTPPNPQKKDGSNRCSGVMSSRYATPENYKPIR